MIAAILGRLGLGGILGSFKIFAIIGLVMSAITLIGWVGHKIDSGARARVQVEVLKDAVKQKEAQAKAAAEINDEMARLAGEAHRRSQETEKRFRHVEELLAQSETRNRVCIDRDLAKRLRKL